MIPPCPRRCGDVSQNSQEASEDALAYIFEINEHESFGRCGDRRDDPARVLCCRCVARNALLDAGWKLSEPEGALERWLNLESEHILQMVDGMH